MRFYAVLTAALLSPCLANAGLIFNFFESGPNVVATATGSVNLAGLTLVISSGSSAPLTTVQTFLVGAAGSVSAYSTAISPALIFANGSFTAANTSAGPLVGLQTGGSLGNVVYLPVGYVSGTPLSSTATWNNRTLAGLGLAPGVYQITIGTDPNRDFATVNVGTPEPHTLTLAVIAGLGMLALRRRQLRSTRS